MVDLQHRQLRFELRELCLVAMGAVPGALCRWQIGMHFGPYLGGPAGANLLANVLGSFLLGFLAGPIPRRTGLLLVLGIGFCGSLTTFSSWLFDVMQLIQQQRQQTALLLIASSLCLGIFSAVAGMAWSRSLFRHRRG